MNIQTGVYAAIAAAGVLLAAGLFLSAVRRDGLPTGRAAAVSYARARITTL